MKRKKLLPLALLAITVGLVLIIVFVVVLPGGSSPSTTPTPTPSEYLEVGEWYETSEVMVILTSVLRAKTYGPYWGPQVAPPAMVFVLIQATATVGNSPIHISSADFAVRDSEGHQYKSQDPSVHYKSFESGTVSAGHTVSGYILFTVRQIASGLEVTYSRHGAVVAVWNTSW